MGIIEDQAKQALLKLKFAEFFDLLPKSEPYTRSELTGEAVKVATLHGNVNALRQLASVEVDMFYAERLLKKILKALVKLKAIEAATTIVVLGKNQLTADIKWYLFATALLKNGDYTSLSNIFDYIKQPYQKSDIVNKCLKKISPEESLLEWLEWLDRYTQNENYIPSELLTTAVTALLNCNSFDTAYDKLSKMKSSTAKHSLIEKLYLTLIENRKDVNILCLEKFLPEEQRWLSRLRRLPEDESQFDAVENITNPSEAERLISPAVSNLVQRQLHQEDERLAKVVIQAAEASPTHTEITIRRGCAACFKFTRFDAGIHLLPKLDSYARTQQLLLLTEHELKPSQYQAIAPYITSLFNPSSYCESSEAKILKKIPPEFICEERKRRAQHILNETQTAFSNCNKVSTHHPQFNAICQTVEKLFEYDELNVAFTLCQRLVPCNKRDQFANRLFQLALSRSDFSLASNSCKLFRDSQHGKNLSSFMQQHQKRRYRRALSSLTKLANRHEYLSFIYDCAETILNNEEARSAIQYLEGIGILALPDNLEVAHIAKEIKKRIIQQLMSNCKDANELNQLILRLKKYSADEIPSYLLSILLEREQLSSAIYLLNLHTEERDDRKELPKKLSKKMKVYLGSRNPTIAQLTILTQINCNNLLSEFIRWSFKSISLEFTRSNLEVIAATPDPTQKNEYLIETIILAILHGEFQLALNAANHLDVKNKTIWLQIINHAKENNCIELLTLFQAELIRDERLIKWVITRWASKVKSPKLLFDYILQLLSQLQLLPRNQSSSGSDVFPTYYRKISLIQSIFIHTFLAWYQSYQRISAYGDIITGITSLLPEAKIASLEHQILTPLREASEWLIDHNQPDALHAIKLVLDYETSFPGHFLSNVIDKLIKQKALNTACALIALVDKKQCYWLESTALKIAECYFQQADFLAVIKLLKPYQSLYTTQNNVTNWVVILINKDNLENANLLIDNLLPNSQERCYETIINALIAKKHVRQASHLLPMIKTPAIHLRLKQELQQAYLEKLEDWIGQDRARSLYHAHQKIIEFLRLAKNPEQQAQANRLKNEMIVELRSQLDKAFLYFYRANCGTPPMRGGNPVNIYFPVVPDLDGKTVQERLQEYFVNLLKTPNFSTKCPEVFAFLLKIQPLHNPKYTWLRQLYKFANLQKHDADLPFQPIIEGITVDMIDYLPKLLTGTNELLLKLFKPRWDNAVIAELCFTHFVPLESIKLDTSDTNYNPKYFRPASPPRPPLKTPPAPIVTNPTPP